MNSNDELDLEEARARMRQDVQLIGEALRREADELRRTAAGYIEQHPYQAVGAAFAVGFLLSGGLISRTTWRSLAFGSRFFVGRLVRELVSAAGLGLLFKQTAGGHEPVEQ